MSKEKKYKFDRFGYAQLLLDLKNEKLEKINSVTSIAVVLAMFGLGLLNKEFLMIILANKGINKVTSWLIG